MYAKQPERTIDIITDQFERNYIAKKLSEEARAVLSGSPDIGRKKFALHRLTIALMLQSPPRKSSKSNQSE